MEAVKDDKGKLVEEPVREYEDYGQGGRFEQIKVSVDEGEGGDEWQYSPWIVKSAEIET